MGEFRPPIRSDFDRNAGEKWVECHLCGAKRTKVLVHFYSGRVAPVVGEKITGLTSLDTCIVEGYTLISGTFAGGDAVGIIEGNTPTGYDDNNLEVFHKDEELDGNIGGVNIANATNHGAVQISGRLIPDSEIVEYQGLNYCRPHFLFKFAHEWKDDTKIDTATEGDRE
jgi:hypothetical protein